MPLKLIPPGRRKGNPYCLVRGRFLGRDIEVSAETRDPVAAERFKNAIERRILDGCVPGPEATVGFHTAADLYAAAKGLGKDDERRIANLKSVIPNKPVRAVVQADLDAAAVKLHAGDTPETKNRNVYTPAAAILHYAARNDWCEWKRFDRPKQKQAETRAAKDGAAEALLRATSGKEHLLILWLFKHGTRISGALSVDCGRIDLKGRTYELFITKNRTWRRFPIDDEVWELLANDPDVQRAEGRLFPWRDRWRVYEWLRPLCERAGVAFTPHMARHWLGKTLNKKGAGLRTIMTALGQSNYKSAIRYVAEDIEAVRESTKAIAPLGKKLGKRKRSA